MKRALLTAILLGAYVAAGAQETPAPLTLRKCLEIGLEQNYDVRIVRNEERISDNDATAGNAGMLPEIGLSAGYSGTLDNDRTTTPRDGDAVSESGVYDQTASVGLAVNWTLFDGFRIRTNYKRLKEMQQMGALKTRITIEDFMASLTAEYYNYIQQTLRLQNFRYAVGLSRNGSASPRRACRWATSRASTCCKPAWTSTPTVRNTCPSTNWSPPRASASTNCWPTRTSTKNSASATR